MYDYSNIRGPLAVSAVLSLLFSGSEATLKVVDTAGDVCQESWNLAKGEGFDVAIPRGVFEACSVRGNCDDRFPLSRLLTFFTGRRGS